MPYARSLSRRQTLRRNSILKSVKNMATIFEESEKQIKSINWNSNTISKKQIKSVNWNSNTDTKQQTESVNWNSYIDPRNEQQFEKKIVQYLLPNWEHEQDLFDDELLKSMFHWNPDDYCKLPNKTRRNRNRIRNSNSSRHNLEMDNSVPESIKKFGPPPGLTKQQPVTYEKPKYSISDSDSDSKNFRNDSSSPIPSDEELLKNRSAIFATDFSSDSCCFSDNENNNTKKSSSSSLQNFKLNPTAQVFQPRFV
jgi:hypothetical protein